MISVSNNRIPRGMVGISMKCPSSYHTSTKLENDEDADVDYTDESNSADDKTFLQTNDGTSGWSNNNHRTLSRRTFNEDQEEHQDDDNSSRRTSKRESIGCEPQTMDTMCKRPAAISKRQSSCPLPSNRRQQVLLHQGLEDNNAYKINHGERDEARRTAIKEQIFPRSQKIQRRRSTSLGVASIKRPPSTSSHDMLTKLDAFQDSLSNDEREMMPKNKPRRRAKSERCKPSSFSHLPTSSTATTARPKMSKSRSMDRSRSSNTNGDESNNNHTRSTAITISRPKLAKVQSLGTRRLPGRSLSNDENSMVPNSRPKLRKVRSLGRSVSNDENLKDAAATILREKTCQRIGKNIEDLKKEVAKFRELCSGGVVAGADSTSVGTAQREDEKDPIVAKKEKPQTNSSSNNSNNNHEARAGLRHRVRRRASMGAGRLIYSSDENDWESAGRSRGRAMGRRASLAADQQVGYSSDDKNRKIIPKPLKPIRRAKSERYTTQSHRSRMTRAMKPKHSKGRSQTGRPSPLSDDEDYIMASKRLGNMLSSLSDDEFHYIMACKGPTSDSFSSKEKSHMSQGIPKLSLERPLSLQGTPKNAPSSKALEVRDSNISALKKKVETALQSWG